MSRIEYINGFVWEKGNRINNEDSICLYDIQRKKLPVVLGIVCDGIAGLSEGAFSSTYTVTKMQKEVTDIVGQYLRYHGMISLRKKVNRKIYMNHMELVKYSKKERIKTGTTISMLLLIKNKYFLFHIGDSRIYSIKKKKIHLLTIDDTDKNNILIHALGIGSYKMPFYKKGIVRKGQEFLLCSDGFYRRNNIKDNFTNLSLCEEKVNQYLETVTRRLMEQGENDNISAVYIKRIR